MEQLLQNVFRTIAPSMDVQLFSTAVSDLLVTDTVTGLMFVVEVKSNSIDESQLAMYLNRVAEAVYEQGAPNLPVLLCKVDEEKHTASIALVVEWCFGTPLINKKIKFVPLTIEHWPVIYDNIKAADNTIRMLETTNCMVVKHIVFSYGDGNHVGKAQLVYLRPLRLGYAMNQPDNETPPQEFEKYLKDIPEIYYPRDKIDEYILRAVKKQYSDAKTSSTLLIFSTELNKLRKKYQNGLRYDAWVDFMPPESSFQNFVGTIIPELSLDIFVENKACRVGPEQRFFCDDVATSSEELRQLGDKLKMTVRSIKSMIV